MVPACSHAITRQKMARLMEQYPGRVPVMCKQPEDALRRPGLPAIRKKWLAPVGMTVESLKAYVKKFAERSEGAEVDWHRMGLYSHGKWLRGTSTMAELFLEESLVDDGCLHIELRLEEAESSSSAAQFSSKTWRELAEAGWDFVTQSCTSDTEVFHMPELESQDLLLVQRPEYILSEGTGHSELREVPRGHHVTRAWYGNPENREQGIDVTELVRKQLKQGLIVRLGDALWGDPAPGASKVLEVYTDAASKSDLRTQRQAEKVEKWREKFPARLPIVCRQPEDPVERPGLPGIDIKGFAPDTMKLEQVKDHIRNKCAPSTGCSSSSTSPGPGIDWSGLLICARGMPIDPATSLKDVYEEHRSEDGLLYLELRLPDEMVAPADNANDERLQRRAVLEEQVRAFAEEIAAAEKETRAAQKLWEADEQQKFELLVATQEAELKASVAEDRISQCEKTVEALEAARLGHRELAQAESERACQAAAKMEQCEAETAQACSDVESFKLDAWKETLYQNRRAAEAKKACREADLRAARSARRSDGAPHTSLEPASLKKELQRHPSDQLQTTSASALEELHAELAVREQEICRVASEEEEEEAIEQARREVSKAETRAEVAEEALQQAQCQEAELEKRLLELLQEKKAAAVTGKAFKKVADGEKERDYHENVDTISLSTRSCSSPGGKDEAATDSSTPLRVSVDGGASD